MTELIQHHVKYKEIHGIDKIILLSRSTHSKLHRRLRKEGKCRIPACDLNVIAIKANQRTEKHKETERNYQLKNLYKIEFSETIAPYIQLFETLIYNQSTNNVRIVSRFKSPNSLPLIGEW